MKTPTKAELVHSVEALRRELFVAAAERDRYKEKLAVFITAFHSSKTKTLPSEAVIVLLSAYDEAFK